MDARAAIKQSMGLADFVWKGYLADLTDTQLLERPVPGANHIAWQIGHLIGTTHRLGETCCPGSMPPLPAGFTDRHTNDTAASDNPDQFLTKNQYLAVFDEQRAAMLAAIERLDAAELDRPVPGPMEQMAPNVGALLLLEASHWTMHAGQWAVIRRKLGRPPLF